MIEYRPWGHYQILHEEPGYKVKKIVVHPGHKLSYQKHSRRDEHWTIVSGSGLITINDFIWSTTSKSFFIIHKDEKHRIENNTQNILVIIEVQIGDYLEEDDIERLEDDYGRA